jgi:putrescine transport system permease protein
VSKQGQLAISARAGERWGPFWSFMYRFGPLRWSAYVLNYWGGRRLVIALPFLWLTLFFLIPFIIVLKISFSEVQLAMPPYAPLWEWTSDTVVAIKLNMANYHFLFTDDLYVSSYFYSV